MLIVPRHVRKISEDGDSRVENPIQPLSEFRDMAAWVLLGEPGAGKSVAFEEEAGATDGLWISIAKFLSDDPDVRWQGKTLFLDGLDETRAGGGDVSVLLKLRAHLRKLGNPPFRIACRAADWYGSTDSQAISDASPDGRLAILLLEPLSSQDITAILRKNHDIANPDSFVQNAAKHGIDELLKNPQTLKLLAESIRDEQWPSTRQETYQLACKKMADEDNKEHRIRQHAQPILVDKLLEAAGQLCAILLLSDSTGLALDAGSADQHFPLIDTFSPPDLAAAQRVAGRKLFRPSPEGEERVVPSHRSIAEYLAAQWLAEQIDRRGLPLRRVMNLLLGLDDRTVAGLRGLYGWLALHCRAARSRLIEADPLTVIVYGDIKPMPLTDKRHLLASLLQETKKHLTLQWQVPSTSPFGALADPGLAEDFSATLKSPDRDEVSQSFVDSVLEILVEGDAIPELAGTIKTVILDSTRKDRMRKNALPAWLKQQPPPEEAISLLDSINDGRVADPDDELAGQLLSHLYPNFIEPEALLRYLHAPKGRNLVGGYSWFWGGELPEIAPASHLPVLLDQLSVRTDLSFSDEIDFSDDYRQMLGTLLTRGIEIHGEDIECTRLFAWLGIGADKYGESPRDQEHLEAISRWLENHPKHYKAILALCYQQCEGAENVGGCLYTIWHRLHGAAVPEDIGLWHLERASQTANNALAENHLYEAIRALIQQCGSADLSLEKIENWGAAHPERQHWLAPLLKCEITDWRLKNASITRDLELRRAASKRERSIALCKHLPAFRAGTASAGQMHQLASVWMNHYSHGKTPLERFDNYCENGAEALAAAESGFFLCPERHDLPSVAEIIDLSTRQQEHYFGKPCLIGMELRWRQGVSFIDTLSDETLRRMLAFRLTYGANSTPEWFTYFVRKRPTLLAEVLVDYASTTLKAGKDSVSGIHPLAHDPDYRDVAQAAVPQLLRRFPVRVKSGQLPHLANLLKAALRYSAEHLPEIIERKLAAKGMDVAQKVYWLTMAMLLDPPKYEQVLWQYIGKSWTRANHLCAFLSEHFVDLSSDYPLSARTIGKLIELLTPHAELERRSGFVNEAMQRGDSVRSLVTRLGSLATEDAAREIERLHTLPTLGKLKHSLDYARYQVRLRQREAAFRFPPVSGVARILANREPTSTADLAALTVEHLDEIAHEIRHDNDDGVRAFWNIENKKPTGKREENLCRDILLTRLRMHLASTQFGIDCQPEGDYANDKRADIRLSYRNEFELPIEIKRDDNRYLWTALRSQLIGQYTDSRKAEGHGIYLVLWFGNNDLPAVKDGGKKPISPETLQARLEAQLDPEERRRIFVRVLDVSWPKKI